MAGSGTVSKGFIFGFYLAVQPSDLDAIQPPKWIEQLASLEYSVRLEEGFGDAC
jgi:hypothetical protein